MEVHKRWARVGRAVRATPAPAAADKFLEHYSRGLNLYKAEKYEEAITEFEAAYAVLARGGTAVVAGQVADGMKVTIDPFVMSDQELSLIGSNYGSSKPATDFPLLVEHYMRGRIDLDSLVTRVIDLQDINDAFDEMKRGIGIRSVIRF